MALALPLLNELDGISIPVPCTVPWNEMLGDSRTRHCSQCRNSVHDVSELSRVEALKLVCGGESVCLRVYRRPDGRVLTSDCSTKRERIWKWLNNRSVLAASVFALLFLSGCRTATMGIISDYYFGDAAKASLPPSIETNPMQSVLGGPAAATVEAPR
jgi:hypothetical protein